MIYLIIAALLLMLMIAYFKIADRFNIIDKPNERSSHTDITIRGGGVVFPFAMILYAIFFNEVAGALLGGILLVSAVSFWDDVSSLSNKGRLLAHLIATTGLLLSVNAFQLLPTWIIPLIYIVIIGVINAYNFMDGINGITGTYSLVVLGSLWFLNQYKFIFTDPGFILCAMIACSVFLFFNFRKKARCFAGDVGSVSIGFWIVALLLMVVIQTNELKYVLFLAVYGVDTICTIIHRLILKQNIFKAHRLHFYQILVNERKVPHLAVAALYAVLQLIINTIVISTNVNFAISTAIVCIPLVIGYVIIKPLLMGDTAFTS